MKKILVVFTGGTIGAKTQNNIIDVDDSTAYDLISAFNKKCPLETEFETLQPFSILSENLIPLYWEKLYNTLIKKDLSVYDGIVITHGTDTLPYTTAVFSFLLLGISKPVVFIASNYSIDDPKSNGIDNFISAVEFITNEKRMGVFSIYKNDKGRTKVYLGTRLLSANELTDQYESYKGHDFGEMESGKFIPLYADMLPAETQTNHGLSFPKIKLSKNIMAIKPYPGLDYSFFSFQDKKPAAILHLLYHSSTACVEPDENSIIAFAEKCRKLNIALYLLDCRFLVNNVKYSSSGLFEQTNANFLSDISFEAAYAKLTIAYNQEAVPPDEYMKENLFFEYVR